MLRYYLHDGSDALRFRLLGALTGADVVEVEQCWRTALSTMDGRNFLVDVSDVTKVDDAGRALLELWSGSGAQFIAESEQSRSLVESIMGRQLPPAPRGPAPCRRLSLRFAALVVVIAISLSLPATVLADEPSAGSAAAVLSRYTAGLEGGADRAADGAETLIDIEASLPKLAKNGRLQVVRRLIPLGRPEYQVLQSEGDRTVRQQVIARYLSADALARSLPPSSISVSPANYKFHFIAAIGSDRTLTYVFRISPRKKRVGLIQGELWIDAASGIAVRQSGRFVKRPSVFLRRVEITQDTDIHEGVPYLRITRLGIDTLLAGRAELTIKEHPGCNADMPVSAGMLSAPTQR
jgi:hypothetical protein